MVCGNSTISETDFKSHKIDSEEPKTAEIDVETAATELSSRQDDITYFMALRQDTNSLKSS